MCIQKEKTILQIFVKLPYEESETGGGGGDPAGRHGVFGW